MSGENYSTGGVYALGNFDGVHRGHRAVLQSAITHARALSVPTRVLTFEPHPRSLFQPHARPFRLTPARMKERLLKQAGIEDVVNLSFTAAFAQMTAQDFVDRVLLQEMGARHVVAGWDFTFGYNREGNMSQLAEWLAAYNVGVTEVAPEGDGVIFSSTRIRDCLIDGDIAEATEILGRDWSIAGIVIEGARRGRHLGVPTANIALGEVLRPKFGVYAIRAGRAGEALTHKGVANIGVRPTVDGAGENLEAHLFDFDQDIYGQEWEFALTRFIRPERKFDGLDALKAQIAQDIDAAKSA